MTPTTDQLRDLLKQTGLGQREAARVLKLHQVKLNERKFRHYLTGKEECPEGDNRALRDLANDLADT